MSRLVTRAYLQTRYWIATLAILGILAIIVGIGAVQLTALKNNAGYSAAFIELTEATNDIEHALLRAKVSHKISDEVADLQTMNDISDDMYTAVVALAEVFTALRMSDPDSDDIDKNSSEADDNRVVEDLGLDRPTLRERYNLEAQGMPSEMVRVWESEEGSVDIGSLDSASLRAAIAGAMPRAISLEDAIGEYLQLALGAQQKIQAGQTDFAQIRSAVAHYRNTIRPALSEVKIAIRASADRTANMALWVLIVGSGTCAAVILAIALFLFRPMARNVIASQMELVTQRDLAVASAQAKKDFLAVMSHELRTPMNGVLGFASLALRTDLSPTQRDYIETIKSSGEGLLELLNDILDISKIEAGSLELEPHRFSIHDTIDAAIQLMAARAFEKRLDLTHYVDADLPHELCGDSGLIRKLMLNLVGNAIKFTEAGGVAIEVCRATKEAAPSDRGLSIAISVRDTGIGIPDEKRLLIFDRFAQADSTTQRLYEGTGLGLTICKEIAEAMEGQIWVESTVGKGSTFHAVLKLEKVDPEVPSLREFNGHDLSGVRVLVVDDNALNCRIAKLQLSAYGARSDAVQTCEAALGALAGAINSGDPYQVCVIDQMMPVTDGVALLRMIRTDEKYASLKTILSSSAGIRTDKDARSLGFDAAVPKPVNQERLIQSLADLIAGSDVEGIEAELDAAFEAAQPTPQQPPKGSNHLLVVEDNVANLKLATLLLEDAGYTLDTAINGVEAVAAATRFSYQAILMDIRMPIMDGLEATRRIRQLPGMRGNVPVIAMTADIAEYDDQDLKAAGMQAVIPKPIDEENLLKILASAGQFASTKFVA